MGDNLTGKINRDERHVLRAIHVFFPRRNNRLRRVLDQVIDDRQVVCG